MWYRKKPVLVEAYQITPKMHKELLALEDGIDFDSANCFYSFPKWLQDAHMDVYEGVDGVGWFGPVWIDDKQTKRQLVINTLEGKHTVNPNDYIIKGVKGELYPCKKDIFHLTYEVV